MDGWFAEFEKSARGYTLGRLKHYLAFRIPGSTEASDSYYYSLAEQGVNRAKAISTFLNCVFNVGEPGAGGEYIFRKNTYQRWLNVASYRESLRFVLHVERIEVRMGDLTAEQRTVLQLRYIDQMSDEEVARVLGLRLEHPPFADFRRARTLSVEAYKALCSLLEKHLLPTGEVPKGRYRDFSAIFPMFPGLTLDELRPTPSGGQS